MLLQLVVNGLVQGAIYSLVALGFALILYVTGTFHFAHGAVYTWGAYLVYTAHVTLGLPMVAAAVVASAGCALIGCGIELLVYRPVRRRSRSHMSIVVASIGVLIVLGNVAQLVYGADSKLVANWPTNRLFTVGGVDIRLPQAIPFVVGLGICGIVILVLYRTRVGLLMRGVSINPLRSQILGGSAGRAGLLAFAIGSALLGPAAALISLDQGVSPTGGFDVVLVAGIATIAGGVRRPAAAVGGALILSLAQNIGIWQISSQWKATIGYGVLILLITVRPYGIFGTRDVRELRGLTVGYQIGVAVTICLYAILAVGYNLQIGQAGLFSVAHGAFYGIGVYGAAIVTVDHGFSFVPAVLVGTVASAAASLLLGLLTLRVHGDYLVVASFGFQLIVISVIVNWPELTNGPIGILGINRPSWLATDRNYLIMCAVVASVCVLLCVSLTRSPFGRAVRAARDDSLAASSIGKNVNGARLAVFVFSSALAGLAGGLYAFYQGFVSPISFSIEVSIVVLAMVILGGLGRVRGALAGVVILVLLPELISELDLSSAIVGPVQQIIYGGMLILVMIVRPEGVFGVRARNRPTSAPDFDRLTDAVDEAA